MHFEARAYKYIFLNTLFIIIYNDALSYIIQIVLIVMIDHVFKSQRDFC